mmetsp:Transcript_66087/g.171912  ORF Transcript_66087/g.171912 Transcript_66087/m.171912 type:complete len:162 (-) Transcript_66087:98-583(-)
MRGWPGGLPAALAVLPWALLWGTRHVVADRAGHVVADEGTLLRQGANATRELRASVSGIFHASTEQMKSLTSLLTSSARGTDQIKNLMLEMVTLDKRMQHFTRAMEECHQELHDLQSQSSQILSPDQANDPLLGGAASLLQLRARAETLRQQVSAARLSLL